MGRESPWYHPNCGVIVVLTITPAAFAPVTKAYAPAPRRRALPAAGKRRAGAKDTLPAASQPNGPPLCGNPQRLCSAPYLLFKLYFQRIPLSRHFLWEEKASLAKSGPVFSRAFPYLMQTLQGSYFPAAFASSRVPDKIVLERFKVVQSRVE